MTTPDLNTLFDQIKAKHEENELPEPMSCRRETMDVRDVIAKAMAEAVAMVRPPKENDAVQSRYFADHVEWGFTYGTQVWVTMDFTAMVEKDQAKIIIGHVKKGLQKWVDDEMAALIDLVAKAAQKLSSQRIKPEVVELHYDRMFPVNEGSLFGMRLERTTGAEKVLSSPEIGRYVLL